jgi:hypothetical protein
MRDSVGQYGVNEAGTAEEEQGQRSSQSVSHGVLSTVEAEEVALEDSAPGPLLRAGHLVDADARILVPVDHFSDTALTSCAAQVAHVLIEKAM